MPRTWVVNASPVIVLAKAGLLHLPHDLGAEVLVPGAVIAEIMAGPEADPARRALEAGWGGRIRIDVVPAHILEWSLGAGESSVLAGALERPGARAVLDDAEARSCARTLGVPLLGTLGILVLAARLGAIDSLSAAIDQVRGAGLHIADRLVDEMTRTKA